MASLQAGRIGRTRAVLGRGRAERWWAPRAVGRATSIALYGLAGGMAVAVWATLSRFAGTPVDARCFYDVDPAAPYWKRDYAFFYSPAAAQAMIPLQAFTFEAFTAVLRAAELAALIALTGPLLPLVVFWSPVASEINAANINLLIVAVAVWGFRWPALWSFVLLTKVTPGVGILWFAIRREWHELAVALAATLVIVALSLACAPVLWFEWPAYLATVDPSEGAPLWGRVLAAAAIVVWGARTGRPWTLVVAVTIALPRLYLQTPAMLVGLLYYVRPKLGDIRAWGQSLLPGTA